MLEYHADPDRARILERFLKLNDVAFTQEDLSIIFKIDIVQSRVFVFIYFAPLSCSILLKNWLSILDWQNTLNRRLTENIISHPRKCNVLMLLSLRFHQRGFISKILLRGKAKKLSAKQTQSSKIPKSYIENFYKLNDTSTRYFFKHCLYTSYCLE